MKLLRVIQEGELECVGGEQTIRVDVRIITATNKDLNDTVRKSQFRENLYYRLNVIPIELPPLRKRQSDIPELVEFFLKRLARENKRKGIQLIRMQWSYCWIIHGLETFGSWKMFSERDSSFV